MTTTMKRPRIKTICVATTGDAVVMSKEQQESMDHAHRLDVIKKISQRIAESPNVKTETIVYNPARHRYAIVFCEKRRICSSEEYEMYLKCEFTIVSH